MGFGRMQMVSGPYRIMAVIPLVNGNLILLILPERFCYGGMKIIHNGLFM